MKSLLMINPSGLRIFPAQGPGCYGHLPFPVRFAHEGEADLILSERSVQSLIG